MRPQQADLCDPCLWQYERYAWARDELKPLSQTGADWVPGGMGLSILDNLDSLWLMGLEPEYERARRFVSRDLRLSIDAEVNTFETTIRALAGAPAPAPAPAPALLPHPPPHRLRTASAPAPGIRTSGRPAVCPRAHGRQALPQPRSEPRQAAARRLQDRHAASRAQRQPEDSQACLGLGLGSGSGSGLG